LLAGNIPYPIGVTVDMYYFTNHIRGTGFGTMELLDQMEMDQNRTESELMN
jgi:hypothetical protein